MLGQAPTDIRSRHSEFVAAGLVQNIENAGVTLADALARKAAAQKKLKNVVMISIAAGSVVGIGVGIFVGTRG